MQDSEGEGKTQEGGVHSARPRGKALLADERGGGVGAGVPASGGVGTVSGSTIGLGRDRNGWMPNSTSLSLPLP